MEEGGGCACGQGALGRGLESGQERGMWVGGSSCFCSLCGLFVIARLYRVSNSSALKS